MHFITLSATPLPFWLHYCADPNCGGLQPLVVHVCPEDNPPCTPSRQTTVVPRLDGHQIDQVLFPMQASDGGAGVIATLEAGAGSILGASLLLSYTSPVIVKSDIDITLSYYKVTPAWDGTTDRARAFQ